MAKFWMINTVSVGGAVFGPGDEVDDAVDPYAAIVAAGGFVYAQGDANVDAAAAKALNAKVNRGANEIERGAIMIAGVDMAQKLADVVNGPAVLAPPVASPAGAVGVSPLFARQDHAHPFDPALDNNRRVRGVVIVNVASLAAFVVTQDGVTYVAGDRVLLANQTTTTENGVYIVGTVAGTAPLTRAPDMPLAYALPNGTVIEVSEGTIWAGSSWKSMSTTVGGAVIGTNDPLFYPRVCKGILTLASGTKTLGATEGLFIWSTTLSVFDFNMNTPGGTTTSTVGGYGSNSAGRTAGKSGVAAATCIARVAAGTIDVANNSTVDWNCTNW